MRKKNTTTTIVDQEWVNRIQGAFKPGVVAPPIAPMVVENPTDTISFDMNDIPLGVSEKDVPVVDFNFTTMGEHPLANEKIWSKMEDPRGSKRYIWKITKLNLDSYKNSGKLKMETYENDVLPHPTIHGLIILGSDFNPGFVLDEETQEIAYWRIQCSRTKNLIEISNY
jgi:hypothetical protein